MVHESLNFTSNSSSKDSKNSQLFVKKIFTVKGSVPPSEYLRIKKALTKS